MPERMSCNERVPSYEELLTPEVLSAVRPYAGKLAKRTRGGLEADDLIQMAVVTLLGRKRAQVDEIKGLLTFRIRAAYLKWIHGTNWKSPAGQQERVDEQAVIGEESNEPIWSSQDRYMATGSLPTHDGVKQLAVPNPSESWELPLDIARTLSTLSVEEQQLVRWKIVEELDDIEVGKKLGISRWSVRRHWHPVLEKALVKLRVQLAAYE